MASTALAQTVEKKPQSMAAMKRAWQQAEKQVQALQRSNTTLKNKAAGALEATQNVVASAIHTGETQGALFAGCAAEGYWGAEAMQVMGIDARLALGIAGAGVGLIQSANGSQAANHTLAVSNGLMGAYVASKGLQLGQMLQQKNSGQPLAAPQAAQTTVQGPAAQVTLSGPAREVTLSDAPVATTEGPLRNRALSRFIDVENLTPDEEA